MRQSRFPARDSAFDNSRDPQQVGAGVVLLSTYGDSSNDSAARRTTDFTAEGDSIDILSKNVVKAVETAVATAGILVLSMVVRPRGLVRPGASGNAPLISTEAT